MQFKTLITCSAMVLALGIGSAIAAEPVEKKSIMPQSVQPMAAAELETVRGTWWPVNAKGPGAAIVNALHDCCNPGNGNGFPSQAQAGH